MFFIRLLHRIGVDFIKIAMVLAGLGVSQAHALPSFARQTGMDCVACHVGGFGPQLTPAGIRFKLLGYTDTDGKDGKLPLSAMVVASWTHTNADQDPQPGVKANNNMKMDEASIFLAGRLTDQIGAFVQVTHDGVAHSSSVDHVDVRYARPLEWGGKDAVVGLSLNNNPGVQDPFNTMPVWGFPYIGSPVAAGTGDAASLINGGLEHRVLGASVYGFYDNALYGELGTYRSLSPSLQNGLGLGEDFQKLGGNAYWRLGWMSDQKSQAYQVGLFGWNASLLPDRNQGGPQNRYRDLGVDASYQFLGTREHVMTVNGSFIRERMTDGATTDTVRLNESRLNASYYLNQTWGASAGMFATRGSDPAAQTKGKLFQIDWTPWGKENASAPTPFSFANLRLGAQYWIYDTFAGDSVTAKDHNTAYIFAWLSF